MTYPTGDYAITVPPWVSSLHVVAVGGTGGGAPQDDYGNLSGGTAGGGGADVTANLPVVGGHVYYVIAGGNGAYGGANGYGVQGGGGGGASDIRMLPPSDPIGPPGSPNDTRLLVAAGGGGAGAGAEINDPIATNPAASIGGDAGSDGANSAGVNVSGEDPPFVTGGGHAGIPAGDSNGGCGPFIPYEHEGVCGSNGTFGFGGNAGITDSASLGGIGAGGANGGGSGGDGNGGGGGGGGWYGGGGGASIVLGNSSGSGGGGGSSLVPVGGAVTIDRTATPHVTISFTENVAPTVTLNQPPQRSADNTPTFSGNNSSYMDDFYQVTVKIYAGTGVTGIPVETLNATPNGGTYSVTSPPLPDGAYVAVASQSDFAGNVGQSTAWQFTIDHPPVVTLTGAARTTATEPLLTGTAGVAAGDSNAVTVKLYSGTSATGTPFNTITATPSSGLNLSTGAYNIRAYRYPGTVSPLPLGTYTAVATQSDALGGVGSSAVTFTVYSNTTTGLTASPSTGIVPGVTSVTMTAEVSPAAAGGTVQFWDIVGSPSSFTFVALGGHVPVTNGVATTKATLQKGTFAVVAQFFPTSTVYQGSYSPNVAVSGATLGSAGLRGVRYKGSDHMGPVRFRLLIRHSSPSGKPAVYQYILYNLSFATSCTRGGVKVPGQVTVTRRVSAGKQQRFTLRTRRYVLTGRISGPLANPTVTGTLKVLSGACGSELLPFTAKLAGRHR